VRLHKRTLPVQRAEVEMRSRFWDIVEELDLGYAEMTIAVASVQADVARRIDLISQPDGYHPWASIPGYTQVSSAVSVAQMQFGLTDIETLAALADFQGHLAKYMLRAERHPDDPDRKADEA
jgi:hypothetical protein